MIDFFETKAFGAATVGALTTFVSGVSGMNAWAAIGLGLLVASAFLLTFEKTALSRSPPDVTSARRADQAVFGNSTIASGHKWSDTYAQLPPARRRTKVFSPGRQKDDDATSRGSSLPA
jgi:hypothetical protein